MLYALFSYGQTLNFQKGVRLLLENNYDIAIQRYEIQKANADTITASLRPNPVQKPLAVVIVGGMFVGTILILLLFPKLLRFVEIKE